MFVLVEPGQDVMCCSPYDDVEQDDRADDRPFNVVIDGERQDCRDNEDEGQGVGHLP